MNKDKFKKIEFKENGKFTRNLRKLISFILFFVILCGYAGLAGYQYYVTNASSQIGVKADEFESYNNFNNITFSNFTEAKYEIKGGFTIENDHVGAISILNLVIKFTIYSDDDTDNLKLASDEIKKDIPAGEITEINVNLGIDFEDADLTLKEFEELELLNKTLQETELIYIVIELSFDYALSSISAELKLDTDFGGMAFDESI